MKIIPERLAVMCRILLLLVSSLSPQLLRFHNDTIAAINVMTSKRKAASHRFGDSWEPGLTQIVKQQVTFEVKVNPSHSTVNDLISRDVFCSHDGPQ